MKNKKPTIVAGRRRPGGTSAPAGRAEAPRRRKEEAGSGSGGVRPPISSTGGLASAPRPGGMPRNLSAGGVVLLIILFFIWQLLAGGGDQESLFPEADPEQTGSNLRPTQPQAALPSATSRPRATRAAATGGSGDTWLVMLYQDADDKVLEQDIFLDLNEAERVGSSDQVHIVAQIDRFQGGYQGTSDWVSARRYYVTQDDDLQSIHSEQLADLGEVNMADGATLVDFVTWAMQAYPADHYVLILSDHGMGWPGGWSDPTARGTDRSSPMGEALGDHLYLNELDQALDDIRSQTNLDQFELIGMDACLMGHLEVLAALAPHARYAGLSQETEPALGWAYAAFLEELVANPGISGAELGQVIVDSYIHADQRIVDDQERAQLVGRGSILNSLFGISDVPSASQVSSQMSQNITLAVIDLSVMPDFMEAFNNLAYALQEADQRAVAQARSRAQSFTSIFGKDVPPSYIDLGHFAELAGRMGGKRSIGEASNELLDVLKRAVIAERHGQKKPGATGVSIYFPNSSLYSSPVAGPESYTVTAERFARESLWDEFLAFHYTGRAFERGDRLVTVPDRSAAIESPAAGGIELQVPQVSAKSVAPGESIRLTSDISGANIGYVRLLVGYFDEAANSLYLIDSDYLESANTQELNGVYYPDWGVQTFTLAFDWEPIVYAISDGENVAVALLTPETYGASAEEAMYSVEGIYGFADGSQVRYARLYFSNGQLKQVFGFTGEAGKGAPREITPQPGDTFTILEKWMDLDEQGNVVRVAQQEGETLTFGENMFTWTELYAAPGEYRVGFIVEDLDGNTQTASIPVTVEK